MRAPRTSRRQPGAPWRCPPGLRAAVAAVWLAVLGAVACGAAPQVRETLLLPEKAVIQVGTPFQTVLVVEAPGPVRWQLPRTPARWGEFTLRRAVVETTGNPAVARISLEWQAFRPGRLPLPAVPIRWSSGSAPPADLVYLPGEVAVSSIFTGAGPFSPQPPRGGLELESDDHRLLAALLAGLVLLGLGGWWFLRRKTLSNAPVGQSDPVAVRASFFLEQLEQLWLKRGEPGPPAEVARLAVEIFRDYLSWRWREDFHTRTTGETADRLGALAGDRPEWLAAVRQTLLWADDSRFGPGEVQIRQVVESLRQLMEHLGERENHGRPGHLVQPA